MGTGGHVSNRYFTPETGNAKGIDKLTDIVRVEMSYLTKIAHGGGSSAQHVIVTKNECDGVQI